MLLSEGDVVRLILDLDYGIMGCINQYLVVVPGEPVQYRIKDTAPCVFLDKLSRQCRVRLCWPKACLDYPFRLYLQGGCRPEEVLVRPVAVKMLEDHCKESSRSLWEQARTLKELLSRLSMSSLNSVELRQ